MQGFRDSSSLDKLVHKILNAEKWASEACEKLVRFIESGSGELIIAYTGLGYAAASTLYWLITTLNPSKQPVLQDSDTIALYRLIYREEATTILFNTKPDDPSLIRLGDASRWTGGKIYIVTPKPPETIDALLRGANRIIVPCPPSEVECSLYEVLLAHYTGLRLYGISGKRVDRLRKFVNEGFSVVFEELIANYRDVISDTLGIREIIVSSTGFLEPASYVLIKALRSKGVRASYIPLNMLEPSSGDNILFLTSSVEDYVVKEKRFKAMIRGARVFELRFNLDPLEIPVYVIMLALYMIQ